MDDDYITDEEAAALVRMTTEQLANLRYKGKGPVFYKPTSRHVLYRRSQVLEWLENSAYERTDRPVAASA